MEEDDEGVWRRGDIYVLSSLYGDRWLLRMLEWQLRRTDDDEPQHQRCCRAPSRVAVA